MSSSLIAQLRVVLGLETAAFETGSKRARREMGELGKAAKEVRGLISGLFAVFAVDAMGETIKRSIEHAAALGEQAKALGISTRALQEYRFVAGQTGMTIEQTDKFLGKLSKSLGDARNGAEAPTKAFAALSKVLGKDILTSAKGVDDAIPMISDAMRKIEDPTRRASLAAAILGRSWRDAGALLALGSEGINKLRDSAEQLGIVLSDQQIQNAEETAHKLKALHDVLGARIDGAVAANAKAIYSLADSLLRLAGSLVTFWSKHPAQAAALLGAMVGGRIGGLPGAAAGAVLGASIEIGTSRGPQEFADVANVNIAHMRQIARDHGYKGDGSAGDHQIVQALQRNPLFKGAAMQARIAISRMHAAEARSGDFAMPTDTPPGTGTPPDFLKSGRGHHQHDDSEQRARDNERRQFEIDKEILDEKQQLLQAQQGITTDTEDRNQLALQMLEVEHDQRALEIKHQLAETQLDSKASDATKAAASAQAAKSLALNDQLLILHRQTTVLQQTLEADRDAEATRETILRSQTDALKLQEDLARTTKERRDIELEILRLQYEERRRTLDRIINGQQPNGDYLYSPSDRLRASIELNGIQGDPYARSLADNYKASQARIGQANAGPLQQLLQGIPQTAAEMNEALESVAAKGLSDLTDGIAEASASWIKMGGIAGNVLRQLYTDLMKLIMARYLERPAAGFLGKLLGAASTVASSVGAASGGGSVKDTGNLPKFAGGGSLMIGGMAGVDQNMLSINNSAVARVGRGERIDIVPANGRGRGAYYDMRGAFLTPELFAYIDRGDGGAALQGGALGSQGAVSAIRRSAARALPTGGRR